jgi:hypothetical protein
VSGLAGDAELLGGLVHQGICVHVGGFPSLGGFAGKAVEVETLEACASFSDKGDTSSSEVSLGSTVESGRSLSVTVFECLVVLVDERAMVDALGPSGARMTLSAITPRAESAP